MEERQRLPGVGNEWHRDLNGTEQWIVKEREACASWGMVFPGCHGLCCVEKGRHWEGSLGLDWWGGFDGGNREE